MAGWWRRMVLGLTLVWPSATVCARNIPELVPRPLGPMVGGRLGGEVNGYRIAEGRGASGSVELGAYRVRGPGASKGGVDRCAPCRPISGYRCFTNSRLTCRSAPPEREVQQKKGINRPGRLWGLSHISGKPSGGYITQWASEGRFYLIKADMDESAPQIYLESVRGGGFASLGFIAVGHCTMH